MTMEKNINVIDAYFNGDLSPEGLAEFDAKLQDDVEFQAEFQQIKMIRVAMKNQVKSEVLNRFQELESALSVKKSSKSQSNIKRYIAIAASLILIVSLAYLTTSEGVKEIDGNAIFMENYQAYTNLELGTERGTEVDLTNLKSQAYYAYDLGNYGQAATDLTKLVEMEKTAANYFYLGLSNIEIGESETAFANFNTVINNFSEYKEQAQWYLALVLLKEGESEQALSSLVALVVKEKAFKEQSAKILLEEFSLDNFDTEMGTTVEVSLRPEEEDSPSGIEFEERRQVQLGIVRDAYNNEYSFYNDLPIKGLTKGEFVEIIIVSRGDKGRDNGYAVIVSQ